MIAPSPFPSPILAPAKINLYLHILGKDDRSYHLLDSLVAFCDFGDQLHLRPSAKTQITISGEYKDELEQSGPPEQNLLRRVLDEVHHMAGQPAPPLLIELVKNIPLGGGLGGGSSDAAALLNAIKSVIDPDIDTGTIAQKLGSDIKACLYAPWAVRMQGTGNTIVQTGIKLPRTPILLVNPREHCPTPDVYRKTGMGNYSNAAPDLPHGLTSTELAEFLKSSTTNDLTSPAIETAPVITDVLNAIEGTNGCLLSRLSGSGATGFGLYATQNDCENAALKIKTTHPDWWVVVTNIGSV